VGGGRSQRLLPRLVTKAIQLSNASCAPIAQMNILVFGKDGQLGKAFKAVFDERKLEKLHRISYVGRTECDLVNPNAITALLNQIKPDLIINAAAYTAVDKAEAEVDLAYAINAKAPEIMAQYAKGHGATFLHYSTDYVFDGSKVSPYEVTDARNPLGVYGKSKAAGRKQLSRLFKVSTACFTGEWRRIKGAIRDFSNQLGVWRGEQLHSYDFAFSQRAPNALRSLPINMACQAAQGGWQKSVLP
jgi:nucleoside-diphosphate-sugar epimerase